MEHSIGAERPENLISNTKRALNFCCCFPTTLARYNGIRRWSNKRMFCVHEKSSIVYVCIFMVVVKLLEKFQFCILFNAYNLRLLQLSWTCVIQDNKLISLNLVQDYPKRYGMPLSFQKQWCDLFWKDTTTCNLTDLLCPAPLSLLAPVWLPISHFYSAQAELLCPMWIKNYSSKY